MQRTKGMATGKEKKKKKKVEKGLQLALEQDRY
jgi:hypothetical protein